MMYKKMQTSCSKLPAVKDEQVEQEEESDLYYVHHLQYDPMPVWLLLCVALAAIDIGSIILFKEHNEKIWSLH